jgi:aromatic-amino-acid transaminase
MAPEDPILGQTERFMRDPRPHKVNLGVGMYLDDTGKVPTLPAVAAAMQHLQCGTQSSGYLPINGMADFCKVAQSLLVDHLEDARPQHMVTVQTLGGTGALTLAAELLASADAGSHVLISDPSWENHRAIFESAGFSVGTYPYYDGDHRMVAIDAMLAALQVATPGSIVVFHAACHNPTGYDLTPEQWQDVAAICADRGLTAMLDTAYHGFGYGLHEDLAAVRAFLRAGCNVLVASSFSKNFSLYRQRVGALSVVCQDDDESARVLSQLKRLIRTRYSNPPAYGAQLVAAVLNDPSLRQQWEQDLSVMRQRIQSMRKQLHARLKAFGATHDTSHLVRQHGMFSYTGLTPSAMQRLRDQYGVYGLDSGRICIAALNPHNLDTVASAISEVMG